MAHIQTVIGQAINDDATTTIDITTTPGNFLIVTLAGWQTVSYDVASVGGGGSWALVVKAAVSNQSLSAIFVCASATGGPSTITLTSTQVGGNYINWSVSEYSGLTGAGADKSTSSSGTPALTSTVGPTATLTQARELVIAVAALGANDANINVTTPAGYTPRGVQQDSQTTIGWQFSEKYVNATDAVSAVWNHDSANYSECIATFLSTDSVGSSHMRNQRAKAAIFNRKRRKR